MFELLAQHRSDRLRGGLGRGEDLQPGLGELPLVQVDRSGLDTGSADIHAKRLSGINHHDLLLDGVRHARHSGCTRNCITKSCRNGQLRRYAARKPAQRSGWGNLRAWMPHVRYVGNVTSIIHTPAYTWSSKFQGRCNSLLAVTCGAGIHNGGRGSPRPAQAADPVRIRSQRSKSGWKKRSSP